MSKPEIKIFRNQTSLRSLNRGDRIHHKSGKDILIITGWDNALKKLYAGWDNRLMEIPESDLINWNITIEELKI